MINTMTRAKPPNRLDRQHVAEVRDGLRWVLDRIAADELTAGAGYVARLEGAIEALDVLMGESTKSD
jgi:hypothetical protein